MMGSLEKHKRDEFDNERLSYRLNMLAYPYKLAGFERQVCALRTTHLAQHL